MLGLWLHAGHGPARDVFVEILRAFFAPQTPWRKAPLGVGDERLLGGLDVAATLAAGRAVVQTGLLAQVDGGGLVLPMAARISGAAAARIGAVMDAGAVALARDGFAMEWPTRFGVPALDERVEDETPPGALADRLGLRVDLSALSLRDVEPLNLDFDDIEAAGGSTWRPTSGRWRRLRRGAASSRCARLCSRCAPRAAWPRWRGARS